MKGYVIMYDIESVKCCKRGTKKQHKNGKKKTIFRNGTTKKYFFIPILYIIKMYEVYIFVRIFLGFSFLVMVH